MNTSNPADLKSVGSKPPAIEGFPYVITRTVPAVYHIVPDQLGAAIRVAAFTTLPVAGESQQASFSVERNTKKTRKLYQRQSA